jgi:hypothetical protein
MQPFRDGFTAPTWRHALVLIAGAILTPGRHTVAAALRVMGLEQNPLHQLPPRAEPKPLVQPLDRSPSISAARQYFRSEWPGRHRSRGHPRATLGCQDQGSWHLP